MRAKENKHNLIDKGFSKDNDFKALMTKDIEKNTREVELFEPDNSQLLKELLSYIKPVDFQLLAYPKIIEWRKRMEELKPFIFNSDGSFNADNENEAKEYKKLEKWLSGCKVGKKHYLRDVIKQLLDVAKANDWGLCKKNDFIYLYNGAYWSDLDKEEFQYFLGKVAVKMGVDKYTGEIYTFKDELYKQFMSDAYLPTPKINKDAVLINLQNGTFEITPDGQKLREFNRVDFLTHQLPFEYNPDAQAPIFKKFLDAVLPDVDKQKVLAEYLGYLFTRGLKLEKFLILYGGGANGKSVMFDIIQALLGRENVANYSLQSLTNDNGYFRAKIANKLVNYASEINGRLQSDYLKKMVSGEPVEARLPYGQPFMLYDYAKLMFNTNVLPYEVEHSNAFMRRFLIMHFDVTIPPEKQDKKLADKIIKYELAGVFNWILEGLHRVLKNKDFTRCEAIDNALEDFKKESDSVKMFVDEFGYKVNPDKYTTIKEIYEQYRPYCMGYSFRPVNVSTLMKRLENQKILVMRKSEGNVAYITTDNNDLPL